jgi:hypothetical protein
MLCVCTRRRVILRTPVEAEQAKQAKQAIIGLFGLFRWQCRRVWLCGVWNTQEVVLKKLMRNDRWTSTFLYIIVHGLTRNIYLLQNIVDYLFNEY